MNINGLLRTAHVSQVLTRCPGAFCRIDLYCPAGFRTRDLQGCTPTTLPLGDNCAPAFSCRYFQGGHPPSTNRARRCLTSVIDREPVSATPQLWRNVLYTTFKHVIISQE